jgi:hypothetical protein
MFACRQVANDPTTFEGSRVCSPVAAGLLAIELHTNVGVGADDPSRAGVVPSRTVVASGKAILTWEVWEVLVVCGGAPPRK